MIADARSLPTSDQPVSGLSSSGFYWLALVGGVSLVAGAFIDPLRGWASLLFCGLCLLGLGIFGLYFIAIHDAADAGWATAFRRIPEAMISLIPVGALLVLVAITLGGPHLYSWMDEGFSAPGFKGMWLSRGFFYLRSVAYVLFFGSFGWALRRNAQRRTQIPSGTRPHSGRGLCAAFLFLGSIVLTLASIDWLQSLEPLWFSTMWGVYQFSNLFVCGLAAIILLAAWLGHRGYRLLNSEHLYDLGKLLFAMSTFWMYIWFSQAMLIWYSNLAEEAVYFTDRLNLGWGPIIVLTVLLCWIVPFFVLMPRRPKRNRIILARVSMVILVGHAFDLFVEILPAVLGERPFFGLAEIGAGMLVVALLFLVVLRRLELAALVPDGDPYLAESLRYHS